MFHAVVASPAVESVPDRAALVVRLKQDAPVQCALTSSMASFGDCDGETVGGWGGASAQLYVIGRGEGRGLQPGDQKQSHLTRVQCRGIIVEV